MKKSIAWAIDRDDRPRPLAPLPVELEERLEDWIERDLGIAASGVLLLGRQVPTAHGTQLDILGIDADGNLVVIELKRERTLRETVAQALEYAAWASTLDFESIREAAIRAYGDEDSFRAAFESKFGSSLPDALNEEQRILLVAPQVSDATSQVIEYLSSTYNVPINAISFDLYGLDGQRILVRQEVVQAHEQAQAPPRRRRSSRTMEEFRRLAEENGVLEVLDKLLEAKRILPSVERSQTTIGLRGGTSDGRTLAVFTIDPAAEEGALRVNLGSQNMADVLGCEVDETNQFIRGLSDIGNLSPRPGWLGWYYLALHGVDAAEQFTDRFARFAEEMRSARPPTESPSPPPR